MIRRVYDILLYFREYLLLASCLLISLVFMAVDDTPQTMTLRTLAVGGVAWMQDTFGFVPDYFGLREENRVLRSMNLSLTEEVSRLREARLENVRLRRLVGLRESSPLAYAAARVVGRSGEQLRSTITLSIGEAEGVREGMPIVTDAGLVGRVSTIAGGYAVGQLLANKDVRVSAQVQRSRVNGIVLWAGPAGLQLRNVAKTQDVRPGDLVLTSPFSTMYPPGIRIGVVREVRSSPSELFLTVDVAPGADMERLEEVFVVLHPADSTRLRLERASTPEKNP